MALLPQKLLQVFAKNPVSILNDAEATRLGHKQYLAGSSYANGVTISITNGSVSGLTTPRGVFVPYQMIDGTWRLKANVYVSFSTLTTSDQTFTIAGITFKNSSGYNQEGTASNSSGSKKNASFANPNASTFRIIMESSSINAYYFSFDCELDSKPTWAY